MKFKECLNESSNDWEVIWIGVKSDPVYKLIIEDPKYNEYREDGMIQDFSERYSSDALIRVNVNSEYGRWVRQYFRNIIKKSK